MSRTVLFVTASVLLLLLDRQLQRHGITSVPRWLMAGIWVAVALWSRIDDVGVGRDTERLVRLWVLPVAGVFALYAGVAIWSIHAGPVGLAVLPMLVGVALLLWWVVEWVRGAP